MKRILSSLIIIGMLMSIIVISPEYAHAASSKKCPHCKKAYTYQTKVTVWDQKFKQNRVTEWKKVGAPRQNKSKFSVLSGFSKGTSSTVSYKITGGVSWKALKLGGEYTQSDTKSTSDVIQKWVRPNWYYNLYIQHTFDNFKTVHTLENRCIKCGYIYSTKKTTGTAKIPVKTKGLKFDFRQSKNRNDVN